MSFDYSHRKSVMKIKLNSGDGKPLANETVKIRQVKNDFLFGCGGFDAVELAGGSPDGTALSPERSAFLEDGLLKIFHHNNYATLPFYLGRYESEEGKPDEKRTIAAAEWYRSRSIKTKGHPLCWHTAWAPWLMEYSNSEILKRIIGRIERDVSAFKGLIDSWDVINEVVIMPIFDKYDNAITRVCKEIGRVNMVKEVFAAARRANPKATLLLNDFDTSDDYRKLIAECLDAGIRIDVIGIQSHQHQRYWGMEKTHQVLERFAQFGLPLHFTENTLLSGEIMPPHITDLNDWQVDEWPSTPEGEERQKNEIIELYSVLFAHPQVEAITTWSPRDGGWLNAPAGFLRSDNSEKPSLIALGEKISREWSTNIDLFCTADGMITMEGFRGSYEITASTLKGSFILDGKKEIMDLVLV